MKIIKQIVPENWLFKASSITLTTTFTFYLFEYISEMDVVHHLHDINEKNYIRSFLVTQVLVGGLFYAIIALAFKYFFKVQIDKRLGRLDNSKTTVSELRELSAVKSYLVRFFSLKIRSMQLESRVGDLKEVQFQLEDKNKELNDLTTALGKWTSLFFHLAATLILVYHLSSWYILPILLLILVVIFFFGLAASTVIRYIEVLEKIRIGLIKRTTNEQLT